jgi:multimeric flavodoxin WrbA
MKLLAIIGSPHGVNGNTADLLNGVIGGAQEAGAEIQTISLAAIRVKPCRGCETCHIFGRCVIRDDFESVRVAMIEADGLILASPNYIFSVTAQMKALFDRCASPIHCQMFEGRYGVAVVTSGGGGSAEVEHYIGRFLRALGCWTVGTIGSEAWRLGHESARAGVFEAAARLGRELVEAIAEKRTYDEQTPERQSFLDRMKTLITAMKEAWPHEYEYWKSRGRL